MPDEIKFSLLPCRLSAAGLSPVFAQEYIKSSRRSKELTHFINKYSHFLLYTSENTAIGQKESHPLGDLLPDKLFYIVAVLWLTRQVNAQTLKNFLIHCR
jgi:hypothetical protein